MSHETYQVIDEEKNQMHVYCHQCSFEVVFSISDGVVNDKDFQVINSGEAGNMLAYVSKIGLYKPGDPGLERILEAANEANHVWWIGEGPVDISVIPEARGRDDIQT